MKNTGGVYSIPVTINGKLPLDFIIDSGASDVSIPADVALTLIRTGTISQEDYVGNRDYTLADGSSSRSDVVRLRSLQIGTVVLENVTASIGDPRSPLLLGQAFLNRFQAWSIDNDAHALVLTQFSPSPQASGETATAVIDPAPSSSDGSPALQATAATATVHPSFDCTKSHSVAEVMICGDDKLAMLDNQYAANWTAVVGPLRAKNATSEYLTVRNRARAFLAQRDECARDSDCITQAYAGINDYLNSIKNTQQ